MCCERSEGPSNLQQLGCISGNCRNLSPPFYTHGRNCHSLQASLPLPTPFPRQCDLAATAATDAQPPMPTSIPEHLPSLPFPLEPFPSLPTLSPLTIAPPPTKKPRKRWCVLELLRREEGDMDLHLSPFLSSPPSPRPFLQHTLLWRSYSLPPPVLDFEATEKELPSPPLPPSPRSPPA